MRGTRRSWLALSLLALAGLLGACASPIGIRTADPREVQRYLTRSALTADQPSDFSLNELRRYDLLEAYADEPDAALAELRGKALAEGLPDAALFALAELWFLRASATGEQSGFAASALYAWALLFPEDGFGPGSLSGTVRYISGQPELGVSSSFGEFGVNTISGGSFGFNTKYGFNTPLGERMALRVAAYHNRLGGYMDAVQPDLTKKENVNDGERTGFRAAMRVAPSESFSLTPRIVYQRVKMNGWNRVDAFNILANTYTTSRPAVTLGEREQFTQIEEPFTDEFFLGDLNMKWTLGGMDLTSVSSFSHRDVLVVRDAGALTSSITGGSIGLPEKVYTLESPLDDHTTSSVLSQELRLSGGSVRLRWLMGAFYTSNRRGYA